MNRARRWSLLTTGAMAAALVTGVSPSPVEAQDALPMLGEVVRGRVETVRYRGRSARKLVPDDSVLRADVGVYAFLDRGDFRDGTIEVAVAGVPRADAPADARGFVGVSFRTGPKARWAEIFYLRPTNARADDQLRRNHTTQYVSEPAFPWHRLRAESPGEYESYVDLDPEGWTTMTIVVAGRTARLYFNGAPEPALVVNDLKQGDRAGRIALWAHAETDGYFGPVKVTAR